MTVHSVVSSTRSNPPSSPERGFRVDKGGSKILVAMVKFLKEIFPEQSDIQRFNCFLETWDALIANPEANDEWMENEEVRYVLSKLLFPKHELDGTRKQGMKLYRSIWNFRSLMKTFSLRRYRMLSEKPAFKHIIKFIQNHESFPQFLREHIWDHVHEELIWQLWETILTL